jgi:hypothetical protein
MNNVPPKNTTRLSAKKTEMREHDDLGNLKRSDLQGPEEHRMQQLIKCLLLTTRYLHDVTNVLALILFHLDFQSVQQLDVHLSVEEVR